jgi:conserved repeat domain
LTITLSNSAGLNAAITSFTDNLTTMGTGFTVASSPAATTTCGGSLGAVPGGTSITLSGGSIPAGGNCTIVVPVAVAPNASTGTRTNTIAAGALVTDQGSNAFAAAANLAVSQAAAVAKSWNPTTVLSGGISRLTITISHANGAIAFTNMGLTDLLTSMGTGFVVAATPNVFNNCGGTVTAAAGTTSIVLAGGSLGTGATSCQIRVDVQTPPAGAPGNYRNRIVANNLSTAEGFTFNGNADANLTLQAAPAVTLNKAFTPVVSNGGAPSVASITIANNRPGAIALANVGLVDLLPANVEVYSVPAATFTGAGCSGATISAVPFATQIGISGASIGANSTCTLSVNVTAYVDGNHVNQIPVSTLTSAQGVTNDNAPSATLTILRNVNVAKSFSPNTVEVGGSSTLTIRISNTNTVPRTLADPGLVDTLPLGVTVTAAPAPSTTCSGATVDAPAGGGTVTVRNGSLAASTSCTVTVPVTVGATGTYVNTIPANTLVTLEGSSNPDPAVDTLRAVAKPTITKAFSPASIPAGGTSTITFTLSNPNNGTLLPGGLTGGLLHRHAGRHGDQRQPERRRDLRGSRDEPLRDRPDGALLLGPDDPGRLAGDVHGDGRRRRPGPGALPQRHLGSPDEPDADPR